MKRTPVLLYKTPKVDLVVGAVGLVLVLAGSWGVDHQFRSGLALAVIGAMYLGIIAPVYIAREVARIEDGPEGVIATMRHAGEHNMADFREPLGKDPE